MIRQLMGKFIVTTDTHLWNGCL